MGEGGRERPHPLLNREKTNWKQAGKEGEGGGPILAMWETKGHCSWQIWADFCTVGNFMF